MIDRLVVTVRALASFEVSENTDALDPQLVADCADAVRLELDCPQQELTSVQRTELRRLGDALEDPATPAGVLMTAARSVASSLGLTT